MQRDLEQQIRERAYHLWVADGCCDGRSERHWLAAEREVLAAFAAAAPTGPSKGRSRRAANTNVDAGKAPAKARRRA